MKMKLNGYYDKNHKKGFEVEIDAIKYDKRFSGFYKVRVVNLQKKPVWIAIAWVLTKTAEGELMLK